MMLSGVDKFYPHPNHTLHYVDHGSSRAGLAKDGISHNAVRSTRNFSLNLIDVVCAAGQARGFKFCPLRVYLLQPIRVRPQLLGSVHSNHDGRHTGSASSHSRLAKRHQGPKDSGCPEYRHAYHILTLPYQNCSDSLNVSIELLRAHWQDLYQHADVRVAPLQDSNNSEFGTNDTQSDLSERSLARKRDFQYRSSGGQKF